MAVSNFVVDAGTFGLSALISPRTSPVNASATKTPGAGPAIGSPASSSTSAATSPAAGIGASSLSSRGTCGSARGRLAVGNGSGSGQGWLNVNGPGTTSYTSATTYPPVSTSTVNVAGTH